MPRLAHPLRPHPTDGVLDCDAPPVDLLESWCLLRLPVSVQLPGLWTICHRTGEGLRLRAQFAQFAQRARRARRAILPRAVVVPATFDLSGDNFRNPSIDSQSPPRTGGPGYHGRCELGSRGCLASNAQER